MQDEFADTGAKRVASGDTKDIDVVNAQTTHAPNNATTNPFTMANGERINKPKLQLRQVITDWMTVAGGYKTMVSDMWRSEDTSRLAVASNTVLWGTGARRSMHRPLHMLRFRFLEVMTKATLRNIRTCHGLLGPRLKY
jgi:hypothetical protein